MTEYWLYSVPKMDMKCTHQLPQRYSQKRAIVVTANSAICPQCSFYLISTC